MRVALIGGVSSTLTTLCMLNKYGFKIIDVYGYEPKSIDNVSGYRNLRSSAELYGYSYQGFKKINDCASEIKRHGYDYIFIVGLSQLVCDEIITSAKIGCIGFHPTKLPKGRGRAPIAWLILEGEYEGAATFFQIKPNQKADAGPILAQSSFEIDRKNETVATIEKKILNNINMALDSLLPKILRGDWNPSEQDSSLATEYGVRKKEDGFIDWQKSIEEINRHIRSVTDPYPGAFTFYGSDLIEVRLSLKRDCEKIKGVVGRVLKKENSDYLIQASDGGVWIECDYDLKIGMQLGVCRPFDFYVLNNKVRFLESELERLFEKIESL